MATSSLNENQDFEQWLCKKLTALDIDNDIYAPYITSILEDEDSSTLTGTLTEILESMVENSSDVCEEVINNWKSFQNKTTIISENKQNKDKNIDDILASHIGVTTTHHHVKPVDLEEAAERNLIKQSVMERYSNLNDDDDEEDVGVEENPKEDKKPTHQNTVDSALELFSNTNAEAISDADKQERLKRKEEAIKKKESDKHDRELQKIKKAERKDKEKKRTQKKEKMR